jgi:hypothetical protein
MTSPLQQKIKITGPSVVTANRTRDGAVIWRTASGWSERLGDAAVVESADAARKLLADAIADDLGAVGSYIAPVERDGGDIRPGNLREHIRAEGVTISLPASA